MSSSTATPVASSIFAPLHLHPKTLPKDSSGAIPWVGKRNQLPLQIISSRRAIPSGINNIPRKPIRPLTAYHIFFQIEREFIIQTTAGEDADKSIHDNKIFLDNVPQRYRNTKLLPDWYAGPGKRQKRKHRKQHGKIGFLELSRVISTRWAQLEQLDPETKGFVRKIAKQELDEYYLEMKHYKEVTKGLIPEAVKSVPHPSPKKKTRRLNIRSPSLMVEQSQKQPPLVAPCPDMVPSSSRVVNFTGPNSFQLKNDIDFFLTCIEKNTQHLLPSPLSIVEHNQKQPNIFLRQDGDPLLGVSGFAEGGSKKQHTTKPEYFANPSSFEVDICDDEIMQLWKSHN